MIFSQGADLVREGESLCKVGKGEIRYELAGCIDAPTGMNGVLIPCQFGAAERWGSFWKVGATLCKKIHEPEGEG
jgi:hypothetical protein